MAGFKKLGSFFKEKGLSLLGDVVTGDVTGVVSTILEGVGAKGKSEDEILELLKKDKEAFLKLKELENTHETELLRLQNENQKQMFDAEIEILKTELGAQNESIKTVSDGVADARKMSIETQTNVNVPYIQKIMPSILSFVIIVSMFAIFYLVFTRTFPNENRDLIMMIVGALLSKFSDLVGFYFGSSDYFNQSGKAFQHITKK